MLVNHLEKENSVVTMHMSEDIIRNVWPDIKRTIFRKAETMKYNKKKIEYNPWKTMTPEKMEILLEDREAVEKDVGKMHDDIEKRIRICHKQMEEEGADISYYKNPVNGWGVSVQHSVNDSPFFDLLAGAERRQMRNLVRLLRADEDWQNIENAIDYVFQQIVFFKKKDKMFINDIFFEGYTISAYCLKIKMSDSYVYDKKKKLLKKLCDMYNDHMIYLQETSNLEEVVKSHFGLIWNDIEDFD